MVIRADFATADQRDRRFALRECEHLPHRYVATRTWLANRILEDFDGTLPDGVKIMFRPADGAYYDTLYAQAVPRVEAVAP